MPDDGEVEVSVALPESDQAEAAAVEVGAAAEALVDEINHDRISALEERFNTEIAALLAREVTVPEHSHPEYVTHADLDVRLAAAEPEPEPEPVEDVAVIEEPPAPEPEEDEEEDGDIESHKFGFSW